MPVDSSYLREWPIKNIMDLILRSTLPENAGDSPAEHKEDVAMAHPTRLAGPTRPTSQRQVATFHAIPRPTPSVNTAAVGKFMCGLRVAMKAEPSTAKFTSTDYIVIMGAGDAEILSQLFNVLEQGEAGYEEVVLPGPTPRAVRMSTKETNKIGHFTQYARNTGALDPVNTAFTGMLPNQQRMKTVPENPSMSDSVQDFLNSLDPAARTLGIKTRGGGPVSGALLPLKDDKKVMVKVPVTQHVVDFGTSAEAKKADRLKQKGAKLAAPMGSNRNAPLMPDELSDEGEDFLNGGSDTESVISETDQRTRIFLPSTRKSGGILTRTEIPQVDSGARAVIASRLSGSGRVGGQVEMGARVMPAAKLSTPRAVGREVKAGAPAMPKGHLSTPGSNTLGWKIAIPKPLVHHRVRIDAALNNTTPKRSNQFGLVTHLHPKQDYPVSGGWKPALTAFDNAESSMCQVYVHKVTKRVYVRGPDRCIHRAIYHDQVEIMDKVELMQEDEDGEWDFIDDLPLLKNL